MDTYAYEHTTSPRRSQVQYTYDNYGNVLTAYNHGEVNASTSAEIAGDESRTTNEYINNTTYWVFKLLLSYTEGFKPGDAGLTKYRQIWNYYDNAAYGSLGNPAKGNLTAHLAWLKESGTYAINSYDYDQYGNVIWTKDARANAGESGVTNSRGHTSDIAYDTTYFTYVKVITDAKNFVTTTGFDSLMRPTSVTDPNNQATSTTYDPLSRVTKVIRPGDDSTNPTVKYTYTLDGSAPEQVLTEQKESGTAYLQSYTFVDGLGRTIQQKSEMQTSGEWATSDSWYNNRGLVDKQSVPYKTTSASYTARSTSEKTTAYAYDPLGRATQTTYPDGRSSTVAYAPWQVTTTDALGHQKVTLNNAYGQPAQVKECTGSGSCTVYATTS